MKLESAGLGVRGVGHGRERVEVLRHAVRRLARPVRVARIHRDTGVCARACEGWVQANEELLQFPAAARCADPHSAVRSGHTMRSGRAHTAAGTCLLTRGHSGRLSATSTTRSSGTAPPCACPDAAAARSRATSASSSATRRCKPASSPLQLATAPRATSRTAQRPCERAIACAACRAMVFVFCWRVASLSEPPKPLLEGPVLFILLLGKLLPRDAVM